MFPDVDSRWRRCRVCNLGFSFEDRPNLSRCLVTCHIPEQFYLISISSSGFHEFYWLLKKGYQYNTSPAPFARMLWLNYESSLGQNHLRLFEKEKRKEVNVVIIVILDPLSLKLGFR